MITTSLQRLRDADCHPAMAAWVEHRVTTNPETEFPLARLLDPPISPYCGVEWAIWSLRAAGPWHETSRVGREFAADCAARAELSHPSRRLRWAIGVARTCAAGGSAEHLPAGRQEAWAVALDRRPYGNGHAAADAALAAFHACSTCAQIAAANAAYLARCDLPATAWQAERLWQAARLAELLRDG